MSTVAMIKLGPSECTDLVVAATLHRQMEDVLAPFEVELLWDLSERCLSKDVDAQATADEWAIVQDSLAALRAALAKRKVKVEGGRVLLEAAE